MVGAVLKAVASVAGKGTLNVGKSVLKTGERAGKVAWENKGKVWNKVKGMYEENPESILGLEMKHGVKKGIMAGAIGIGVGSTMLTAGGRGKMGKIEGGDMANMTGQVMSGTLEHTLDNEKASEKLINKGTSLNNHGAGGDIVLALHQLRKG